MARQIRIEFPGAIYHITSRGNARLPVFTQVNDKKLFLTILAQVVERYNWLCHAYCLMDNHYHLLIETVDANLSAGMRQLNGVYTQAFNRNHQKVGHLFQGRFKSVHVERETHLLELCRYIVLNPVRANMISSPDKYTWSSYKATAGIVKAPPYLTTGWLLKNFGKQRELAQKKYEAFINEGINQPSPWENLKAQCILGSENFIGTLKQSLIMSQNETEIPRDQRLILRPPLEMLFSSNVLKAKIDRNRTIQKAFLAYGYSQAEISRHLGLHYSTISRLIKDKTSK
ncbi:transposase [bacterium]|nr:transposase [bacterium]